MEIVIVHVVVPQIKIEIILPLGVIFQHRPIKIIIILINNGILD
ncbi:hypothetical protein BLA29_009005 [Euroglyphus maynei]|uniref:Uncharacterized protein n=1 Tax=Euroglyphus maynei TaxID=6958 RepID=A0A1Y3BQB7_EURMA|nr:hypothetical protein BLA29_009005 [Euroglyphus maynei]